jgi:hypothetical protein
MPCILHTAYWPNLAYMKHVLAADTIYIERWEYFTKQTYRNRCEILSANGLLRLSVPVKKISGKALVKDIEICYREKWQHQHWRALLSAYKNSPYFDFFEEEVNAFYQKDYRFLIEYNVAQLHFLLKALRINKTILFTEAYTAVAENGTDARYLAQTRLPEDFVSKPYHQTFSEKFEFVPNLSALDALFNRGLGAKDCF